MNNLFCILTLFLLCTLLSGQALAKGVTVDIYTTKMGAYSDPGNKEQPGLIVEIVHELCRRLELQSSLVNLPWKRALHVVAEDKGVKAGVAFPVLRSAEREDKYLWLIEVLLEREVFIAKGKIETPLSIEELKQKKIGVIRGSPFEEELRAREFPHIDIAADALANARKLMMGRVDFWYTAYNTASYTFKALGHSPDAYSVAKETSQTPIYIAANRTFPKDLATRMQEEFKVLKASAWYTDLLARYRAVDASRN